MPDTIDRLIYKLELDGSGYLRGVESLSASTQKFTADQEKSNRELKTSETVLKSQSEFLQQTKKNLDAYTGTNEKYRLQLKKDFDSASADNLKLTETVNKNRLAYEAATKAATDFANVSSRASNLQQQTTGGKIPTGPPPGIGAGITQQIAGVINVAEFTEQAQIIEKTKAEFDDLAVSITLAEERMKQLNATDEEFQQLAPIVAKGKEALKQYEQATKGAETASGSLRTQLRQGREDLVKLEQAGLGATKQYFELEKRVAKLTDEFGDQQQRIKILASDTKLLDFGKGAITAATSAFQAFTAVSILAGDESAELQKKTMQLFAAMQLLQSLEQLSNLTRREGVIAVHLQSASQAVYTAVVGASTGALKAFRLALIGTGIGAAIVLIGFLVSKWLELKAAQEKAAVVQKALLDINKKAVESYADEVTHLKLLGAEYANVNVSAKRKKEIQDELQKSYPNYFKDLDTHADKEKFIAEQIDKVSQAIILQAKIQGAQALLSQKFQDLLKKQFDPSLATDFGDKLISSFKHITDAGAKADLAKTAKSNIKDAEKEYDDFSKFITDFVIKSNKELEALGGDPHPGKEAKTEKAVKEIENQFLQKKAALDQQLAELTRKEADSESKIRIEFAARLAKEQLEIERLLKAKKLTQPQAEILKAENIQINALELDKALKDFNKKTIDARAKLNDDLQNLQNKNTQDTLNLLQDEFTRRAQLIEFNEQKELEDARQNTTKRIAAIELDRLLVGEKAYQNAKALLIAAGEQNALNIVRKFSNEREGLSADVFQSLLTAYDTAISNANLIRDEEQAKQLKAAKDNFLSQKITYQQFQDEIKRIKDAHDRDMREGDLVVMKDQLAELDRKIAATEDKTTKHYANLLKQQKEFRSKIAKAESEQATGGVPDRQGHEDVLGSFQTDEAAKQLQRIDFIQDKIQSVAASVISFWQTANEVEAKALDRSIALQEKRVDAAQKIAERGNAQYLKQEQDRLTELNVQRENAARKQLGIDAALQASQILVGITGAIAKIATPGVGVAETITSIAVIIGALATGFSLVKSLQGNVPKLREGTPHLQRGNNPPGTDKIPAWLDEGEAVFPAKKNKKYKKTVEAIYYDKVPAEVLNEFVENYVSNKSVKNIKNVSNTQNKNVSNAENKNISNIKNIKELKTQNVTNDNLSTYQRFVNNITKVPAKVLNSFIENYTKKHTIRKDERKYFIGTTYVSKDNAAPLLPIWEKPELVNRFSESNVTKNNLYNPVIKPVFEGSLPNEAINNFVNHYHQIKNIPQPNYQRIKEAAELKINSDGTMAVLLKEQNRKLDENNVLQNQILRYLKNMGVNVSLDQKGFAVTQMEVINQMVIDKKV